MEREGVDAVPIKMLPPLPPPGACWLVLALMVDWPEKAIARLRGLVALRRISPALPEL